MEHLYDTFKQVIYLFGGIAVGYGFWELCEQYAKKGLRFINPLWFLIMVIWGASGFFFLRPLSFLLNFLPKSLDSFFSSILQLFYKAVPDWDIPLYVWTKGSWEFLHHRSLLFSSVVLPISLLIISLVVLPIGLLIISVILPKFNKRISGSIYHLLNWLRDVALGLSIGISVHLCGDILLKWIPREDTDIKIYGLETFDSWVWFVLNLILGFSIPFIIIWVMDSRSHKKVTVKDK